MTVYIISRSGATVYNEFYGLERCFYSEL